MNLKHIMQPVVLIIITAAISSTITYMITESLCREDQLEIEVHELKKQIETNTNTHNELQAKYDTLNTAKSTLDTKLQEVFTQMTLVQTQFDQLNTNYGISEAEKKQIQTTLNDLQSKYIQLQEQYSSINSQYDALQKEMSQVQTDYQTQIIQLIQQISTLQSKNTELNHNNVELNEILTAIQKQINDDITRFNCQLEVAGFPMPKDTPSLTSDGYYIVDYNTNMQLLVHQSMIGGENDHICSSNPVIMAYKNIKITLDQSTIKIDPKDAALIQQDINESKNN